MKFYTGSLVLGNDEWTFSVNRFMQDEEWERTIENEQDEWSMAYDVSFFYPLTSPIVWS